MGILDDVFFWGGDGFFVVDVWRIFCCLIISDFPTADF